MNSEQYIETQFALKEAQDEIANIERVIECFLQWYPDSEPHEPFNLRRELDKWQRKAKAMQDAITYEQLSLL
jgi:hypothetical protein